MPHFSENVLMTRNFYSIPGTNHVDLVSGRSNFLRSVPANSQSNCFVCETYPVDGIMTFASTRSEYVLVTAVVISSLPNSPGSYFDWAYRCSGELFAVQQKPASNRYGTQDL